METTKRGLASEAKPAIEESGLEFLGCLNRFLPVRCAACLALVLPASLLVPAVRAAIIRFSE